MDEKNEVCEMNAQGGKEGGRVVYKKTEKKKYCMLQQKKRENTF